MSFPIELPGLGLWHTLGYDGNCLYLIGVIQNFHYRGVYGSKRGKVHDDRYIGVFLKSFSHFLVDRHQDFLSSPIELYVVRQTKQNKCLATRQ